MDTDDHTLLFLTTDLAKSYVANNQVSSNQLPDLINQLHQTLANLDGTGEEQNREPAVSIRRSVKKDQIICLECGKSYKMLKRHLRTFHDLTVDAYRERWKLPIGYPIVAPNYAEQRSKLAKKIGLGRKPGTKVKRRKTAA
ncbi:MAG: MucR family transcriptional regulator [Alphaproteobacteria bacterium]|nr:MucR family transcriptional regulator [Alphaproteobacteria bacterium]